MRLRTISLKNHYLLFILIDKVEFDFQVCPTLKKAGYTLEIEESSYPRGKILSMRSDTKYPVSLDRIQVQKDQLTVFQKHYADTLSRKQIPTIGMFSETSSESEQKSLGHPLNLASSN